MDLLQSCIIGVHEDDWRRLPIPNITNLAMGKGSTIDVRNGKRFDRQRSVGLEVRGRLVLLLVR
jgi:hypothetical protein